MGGRCGVASTRSPHRPPSLSQRMSQTDQVSVAFRGLFIENHALNSPTGNDQLFHPLSSIRQSPNQSVKTPRTGRSSFCDGPMSRRAWLRVGGLSFGALCSGFAPNLSQLFAETASAPKDFSVILFWA